MLSIGFGPQVCGNLDEGSLREWLVPDGRGGYAMGTVSGLRTRKYHGLLVVSKTTPAARQVGLASLDPVLTFSSGMRVRLGTHEWSSRAVDPQGHIYLEHFDLDDGLPRWRWRVGGVVLEREVAMVHGQSTLAVMHRLIAGGPVHLGLDALCTWRDTHGERTAAGPPPVVVPVDGGVVVESAYRLAGPGWIPAGQWWHGVHYRQEAARGLAADEDLWHTGSFGAELAAPGATLAVWAWAGDRAALPRKPGSAEAAIAAARTRNRQVVASARPTDAVEETLALAADAFVITTPAGPEVVAGYPWFGAWGRDTMVSYEGLYLATGRAEEGRRLLQAYGACVSEGMVANTSDTGRAQYNSVDASLWFLDAVARHVAATGDLDLAAELLPTMHAVVDAHLTGTRYGIRTDSCDGLLDQGFSGQALTWMDARVDGVPVTPRAGKAVEVNALWVNGLASLVWLCGQTGADPGAAAAAHSAAQGGFARRFPVAPGHPTQGGLLFDVVDGLSGNDDALRPNQLLAWSLPHAPLRPDPQTLAIIAEALLTPLGLRTLAPQAPDYRPVYKGDARERDLGYHQGATWPWLLGPFATACLKADIDIKNLFCGVEHHLSEFGLGSITEVADGQPPHTASGCPFQAWSVAETLRTRRLGHSAPAKARVEFADAGGAL